MYFRIKIWHFQIETIEFILKMNGLIYLHHYGQFSKTDSKSTKVPVIGGKRLYIETVHDVTYSYSKYKYTEENSMHLSCDPYLDTKYDQCVINVS